MTATRGHPIAVARAAFRWRGALALGGILSGCTDGVSPRVGQDVRVALSLQAPAAVSQAEVDALGSAFTRVDEYEILVADSLSGAVVLSTTLPVVTAGPGIHQLDLGLDDATVGLAMFVTVVGREGATRGLGSAAP
jgi:hypothetical protein